MEHTRSEPQLHTRLGQRRHNGHGPLVAVVVAALDDLTDALLLLHHLQLALWRLGPAIIQRPNSSPSASTRSGLGGSKRLLPLLGGWAQLVEGEQRRDRVLLGKGRPLLFISSRGAPHSPQALELIVQPLRVARIRPAGPLAHLMREPISDHERQCVLRRCNQRPSEAISGNQNPLAHIVNATE